MEVLKDPFFKIWILSTSFYYKLAEVPGGARGILKIELKKYII